MATKPEIIAKLQAAGILHDPSATVPVLKALLPVRPSAPVSTPDTSSPAAPTVPVQPAPTVDADTQVRWEAFLAKAEADAEKNGTLHVFNAQKARGEFDNIPDSFLFPQPVRVAQK